MRRPRPRLHFATRRFWVDMLARLARAAVDDASPVLALVVTASLDAPPRAPPMTPPTRPRVTTEAPRRPDPCSSSPRLGSRAKKTLWILEARDRAMNKVVDEIHELNRAESEVLEEAFKLAGKFGSGRKSGDE